MSCVAAAVREQLDGRFLVAFGLRGPRQHDLARDLEHRTRGNSPGVERRPVRLRQNLADGFGLGARRLGVLLRSERGSPGVVPHRFHIGRCTGRIGKRQHRVRIGILRPGEIGRRLDRLRDRYGRGDVVAQPLVELVGLFEHGGLLAEQLRRDQHEVDIVGIVSDRIDADRARLGDVGLVNLRRRLVGVERVHIAADPEVDVARHVHDVAGARHQRGKPVGIGLAALRTIRRLDEMDVKVHRPRVVWLLRQYRLKAFLDIGAAAFRLFAAWLPVVPRLGVHAGLRRDHREQEVIGVFV